jgi:hypothetical protein
MAGPSHTLLIFLKRKAGLTTQEFRSYYEERHVPLIMPYMAGPTSYRRRYLDPVEGQAEQDFDVVTELCFADEAMRDMVLAGMIADRLPAEVIEDEMNFIDRSKTRAHAVTEHETSLKAAQA